MSAIKNILEVCCFSNKVIGNNVLTVLNESIFRRSCHHHHLFREKPDRNRIKESGESCCGRTHGVFLLIDLTMMMLQIKVFFDALINELQELRQCRLYSAASRSEQGDLLLLLS